MGSEMTVHAVDHTLARERERFLNSGAVPVRVRDEISLSWRRCSSWSVRPENIEPPYRPDVNPESRLLRAAGPVLDTVNERLGELGISFIVTDADARILDRRVRERRLLHALDALNVTPGFVFAEDAVGTNGLGTAIELGRTTRIDGHEHYVEQLVQFTCVGVPIIDPVGRRPLGILDVTCAADHNNTLVTLIAEQTARSIENRLFEQHSPHERALLAQFMSASRRTHAGIVVLSERILMTNPQAARLLDGVDQPLVWDHAARAMAGGSDTAIENELPLGDGRTARTRTTPVRDGGEIVGALVEIRPTAQHPAPRPARSAPPEGPPGLVGIDGAFLGVYRAGRAALGERVVVVCGEAGVGKLAMTRALHRQHGGALVVHDAAAIEVDGADGWLARLRGIVAGDPGGIVVRHLDLLSPAVVRTVSAILATATSRGWRCCATFTCGSSWEDTALPDLDAEQLRLPPLRNRLRDIPALVSAFAAPRRVAPEVVQLLMRLSWPGNVRELRAVVARMLAAAPAGGNPGLAEVPPEVRRAAPRRTLTRFERAEVHAILDALAETGGNKKDAAVLLGISRSTLYRKLQAAGIDLENTVF
ncbi:sigma-54-dependent Fis family transcriptional regulator [Pseudonocardia sp. H11422]|uniref:sigma-54-dependent Fis family transcriptional regulator n=1 Tax=Pseudonocardia sp. H11422 TaxID=2835866 RepID=UPI001BDBE569|nr:helix-turn-helix domain-containing protein [Pseudonocardia sp. H11422]